eukprot:Lankesteria_metandrocarpae@DN4874_c0_g1_i1.p1
MSASVCLLLGTLLLKSSQAFDLTCQIPTVYAKVLHSVDVSPDMAQYFAGGALKDAINNFDQWMIEQFQTAVYSAVDVFSDKKIYDAENKCWEEARSIEVEPVHDALDAIVMQSTGSDKRSVYDALYRAASLNWDAHDSAGKGRRVAIIYVTDQPNENAALPAFNNSTDCENYDYPSVTEVITALIDSDVSPIFVVPRDLLDMYRLLFSTDLVVPLSNDVDVMTNYLQMSIDALYCNGPINIPDASTPSPFTTTKASCTENAIAQVLLVQDISHSYTNDLTVLRQKMPEIAAELSTYFEKLEMGLVSFSDKPTPPYGYWGDHCYREETALSDNYENFTTALSSLEILSGNDWRESQYDALVQGIRSDNLMWNANDIVDGMQLLRIALVATDAGPHVAGDSELKAYDETTPCGERDYPSPAQVGATLDDKRVWPVFLVTADVINYWTTKAGLIVTEHTPRVVGLNSDPSEIVAEIVEILEDVCKEDRRLSVT